MKPTAPTPPPATMPALPARGHRPLMGTAHRVTLTTTVDAATKARVTVWAGELGVSPGVVLDHLVSYGLAVGFFDAAVAAQKKSPRRLSQRARGN